MGQIPRSIERISSYHNCHPGKFHNPRCIQAHRISSNYICMYCTHQCSFSELFSSQDQVQGYCPSLTFVLAAVLWRRLPASRGILPPRHISSSRAHSNKIPTAIPMFSGSNFFNGATSGIAWRRHPPEIQDGGHQNEMYIFYGCMANERQFLILSERI